MTGLTKTLLVASVAGFSVGTIVDFGGLDFNPAWLVALPLGAVFLGLSLISFLLETEMSKFDKEEAKKFPSRHDENRRLPDKNCNSCNRQPETYYEKYHENHTGRTV
jgi:hypothetical protein